jgi:hypothetical protein
MLRRLLRLLILLLPVTNSHKTPSLHFLRLPHPYSPAIESLCSSNLTSRVRLVKPWREHILELLYYTKIIPIGMDFHSADNPRHIKYHE